MLKKTFCTVLCFALLLSVCLPAMAQTNEDEFFYTIADGEVAIQGYSSKEATSLVIPDIIEGYPVTQIQSEAFSDFTRLEAIEIPDGVTIIEKAAFSGCSNLNSVTVPDSVQLIGDEAFINCPNLKSITIPSAKTALGKLFIGWTKNWKSTLTQLEGITICAPIGSLAEQYAAEELDRYVTFVPYGNYIELLSNLTIAFEENDPVYSCKFSVEVPPAEEWQVSYVISCSKDDAAVQLSQPVTVKILLPAYYLGEYCRILHIGLDGTITDMNAVYTDGIGVQTRFFTFTTDQLGQFIITQDPLPLLYGDINRDQRRDASDALLALKYNVGKLTLFDGQKTAADVDNNGIINAVDALYILKQCVHIIDKFPVEKQYINLASFGNRS